MGNNLDAQDQLIEGFRLSPQQKYLWSLQSGDRTSAYCSQIAISLEGDLDREALKHAFKILVHRHEILRTSFICYSDVAIPLQVISESDAFAIDNLDLLDLTVLEPHAQAAQIELFFDNTKRKPQDPAPKSLLLHVSLIKLSVCQHLLLIRLPALCADARSLINLTHEISLAYDHCLSGGKPLPENIQYADVAEWQNELLEAEDTALGRDYWQRQNLSPLHSLKLPFSTRSNGERKEFKPRSFRSELNPKLLSSIKTYVQQNETSIDSFLFACWSILLGRLAGKAEMLIGKAYSGRTYDELESAIGLFARYLPVQIKLQATSSFKQLLDQVDQATQAIHQWQESFSWDLMATATEESLNLPFWPFAFDYEVRPQAYISAGIKFSIYRHYTCIDRHDLKLSCLQGEHTVWADFNYDANVYSPKDIARLAEEYQQLLYSVLEISVEDCRSPLSELDILGATERQQLFQEFQGPSVAYTSDDCIHQRFERQVQRIPHQVAVVYQDQQLTYAQLDQRANDLAHHLQQLNVGPETLVGLCLERSLEMVVGILGVLKAGGAYVPLDPIHPPGRLGVILADAQPTVLLTQSHLLERLPNHSAKVVLLDQLGDTVSSHASGETLVRAVKPENLAYVIYTSGSTGQPKGVLIPHQNVTRLLEATQAKFHFCDRDVWTLFHSYGFDFSVWEMWGALLHGGRLVIVPDPITRSAEAFYQLLRAEGVTILNQTPSAFYQFSQSRPFLDNIQRLSIRAFLFGGEVLPGNLVNLLMDTGAEVWNLYGPTEATVWTTVGSIKPGRARPTIGTPIANTKLYILDAKLNPVPIGVSGELYIGGDRLARGYLNRPQLTNERFIANPFSRSPGDKLYKTGDLARYRPNGEIEYLGRTDTQIKLRGFRIELGEIESALQQHPAIHQAVVITHEEVPHPKRLVAYWVGDQSPPPSVSELGDFLKQSLPGYMVPSVFIMLETLPLTPNGKVDRHRLPAPDQARAALAAPYVEPQSAVERFLVKIWQTILGVDKIGIHDNFFELGGDSIQAAICVTRVQETLGEYISVIAIFETLTVKKFAQYLQAHHAKALLTKLDANRLKQSHASTTLDVKGIQAQPPQSTVIPLSFFQQRMWILEQLADDGTGYNVYAALQLKGSLNRAALEQSVTEILRRHDILRSLPITIEGHPYQTIAEPEQVTVPVVQLTQLSSQEQGAEVQRLATEAAQYRFNLARGPLVALKLLQLGEAEHVLLVTLSHLVSDGWSLNLFIRELGQLYRAFAQGQSSPLPELTLQYADFIRWQRQQLQGQVLEDLLSYWRQQLAGTDFAPSLPTDRPRSKKTYDAASTSLTVPMALTQRLKSLSQKTGTTLFMTLLAAFKVLLARYSNQDDIIVGTPIACRSQANLDKLIGFFANNLVLRTDLSGNPSFQKLLGRVRAVALGAYAHQDLPFSKLVEDLNPIRDIRFTPLFQIFFVLQHAAVETTELSPDLHLSPLQIDNGVAIYDLNVIWIEGKDGSLTGTVQYDSSLFDATTITELLTYYRSVLDAVVVNPTQPLSELLPPVHSHRGQVWAEPTQAPEPDPSIVPRTPVEEVLSHLWANVLERKTIGTKDNFFALGGSSLLAAQMSHAIHNTFQIEVSLRQLFDHPTIEQLAEWVTAKQARVQSLQPISLVSHQGPHPLSFAQQRIWFLDQLEPGNPTYNITRTVRLQGKLDLNQLERALNAIVARHEALRTTFTTVDGHARQMIAATGVVTLPVIDLSHWDPSQQAEEAQRLRRQQFQLPFDLSSDLMLRATLIRFNAQEHWLLLVTHHIASDGWSMEILTQELSTLYDCFCAGNPSPLAELPVQYVDFAQWQQQWLQGQVLNTQLNYWKQQLAGAPPLLKLPSDRPRPAVHSYRGGSESFQLNRELTQQLKALSQQSGTTLFMTLLAAFSVLLARYSNQEDIVIGSPIANRNRSELESLIGFFVNTLVLRIDLSGNPTFQDLLRRVRQIALDGYAHQDLPFEKLVQELHPERSLNHNPLFQVLFALQNFPKQDRQLPNLTLSELDDPPETAKFDLDLFLTEGTEGLAGVFVYNADLFEAATIARMVGHFQTLLNGIVSDPDRSIFDLPLLTVGEQHQLLVEWNQTQTHYPKQTCIHEVFEQQVARTPDAVATVFESQQLTYQELNDRANQLAHELRSLGVGPNVLVGIYTERCIEMVVGLLAILKAGGAYVPLDPNHPSERLIFIVQNTQLSVLLAQKKLVHNLPQLKVPIVELDKDWQRIHQMYRADQTPKVTATDLAYVMYTSGSTGQPKGVCITHQGVVRLVCGNNYAELTDREIFLQLAPIAFDAATFEIWGALLNGSKLVIMAPETPSLKALGQAIRHHHVSTLWLTAGLFHLMVDQNLEALKPLRQLLAGGDVLSVPHVHKFLQNCPDCQLINGYGPTENTTFTCVYPISKQDQLDRTIPIGRPIANTQVYILDSHQQPVPIGIPGELYVGGDGLAQGYLDSPELTVEKFIANPFSEFRSRSVSAGETPNSKPSGRLQDVFRTPSSARLYKTGDLARYLPDGNIEFIGRVDQQVKIRGFRIELGEIESVLGQHPAVGEAVVTSTEDPLGEKRLIAYVVPKRTQSNLTTEVLRNFFKQKLPDHMHPSAFVFLEALPLNSNGKVDRHALPTPTSTRQDPESTFVAPRDTLEQQLTRIWEQVLGIHPVSVKDNFFDLGGHSLLAVRLFGKIESTFGTTIPLFTLFQAQTVEKLAEMLRQETQIRSDFTAVPIQSSGSQPPLFLLPGGGGDVIVFSGIKKWMGPDQPIYGLQLTGQNPFVRVEDMAKDCIRAIQITQPTGPYSLAGSSFGGVLAFEVAQQLEKQNQEVAFLGLIDTYGPSYYSKAYANQPQNRHNRQHRSMWQKITEKLFFLSQLSPREQVDHIFHRLMKKLGLRRIPEYIFLNKSINSQVLVDYIPQPYPKTITLLRCQYQPQFSASDPTLGWSEVAAGNLEVHEVPGYHGHQLRDPYVQGTTATLKACLEQAQNEFK